MTELINNLDDLRAGKMPVLSMGDSKINYIRENRFLVVTNKAIKIINEWDLILKLTKKKGA